MKEISRAFGIHHQNIIKTIAKWELKYIRGDFLVVLTLRRKHDDGLGEKEKEVIMQW